MELTINYLKDTLNKNPSSDNPYHLPAEYTYLDILLQQQYGNVDAWCETFDGDMEEAVKYLLQRLIDECRAFIMNPWTGEIISWKKLGINLPDVA